MKGADLSLRCRIKAKESELLKFQLTASFMEIYNEKVSRLLPSYAGVESMLVHGRSVT